MAGKPNLTEARLFSKIKKTTRCWIWTGTVLATGYGQLSWDGRLQPAHRVVYQFCGNKIPPDKQLDHLCRKRNCVNPEHLEPVTCRENLLRGKTIASRNSKKKRCIRGHGLVGKNLYITPNGRRQCRGCRRISDMRYRLGTANVAP